MKSADTTTKPKPGKPNGPTPETLVAESSSELSDAAVLLFGEMGMSYDGFVQHSTDPRLRTAQRQYMVGQIGRVLGNRQLQRSANAIGHNKVNRLRPLQYSSQSFVQKFDPRYHRAATVAGLAESGFSEVEIGRIYAANWERDFSQAHPAFGNVVLAWKDVKLAASRGEPIASRIEAFNSSVNVVVEIFLHNPSQLKSFESYEGYRYYEHMDNPTANKSISIESRNELLEVPRGEHIPQYMIDSREYMKAQLFRAAQAFRGDLGGGGTSGTAERWNQRENELRTLVPSKQVAFGGAPLAAVSNETAQQVASQQQTTKLPFEQSRCQTAAQPRAGWTPEVANGLGRCGHALEDFFAHSNFIELAIGQPAPTVSGLKSTYSRNSQAANPITVKPTTDSRLGTGTFGDNDQTHAICHKIRAIADEIENEMPLVNRVSGRTSAVPKPSDVHIGNEVDPNHDEESSWHSSIGALSVLDNTLGLVGSYGVEGAVGGMLSSPLHPIRGMIRGGAKGIHKGITESIRTYITTPQGVFLLRQISEHYENKTREEANRSSGSHTSLAKDQAGHVTDTLGKLKTIKFKLAQELAVEANKMIVGKMNSVFTASTFNEADEQLQAIYRTLDSLISSPEGHPLDKIVQMHREKAIVALEEYSRQCLPQYGQIIGDISKDK